MTGQQILTKIQDATDDLKVVTRLMSRGRKKEAKDLGAELWVEVYNAVGISPNQQMIAAQMSFEQQYATIRQELAS